jgi:hypothetical protein
LLTNALVSAGAPWPLGVQTHRQRAFLWKKWLGKSGAHGLQIQVPITF